MRKSQSVYACARALSALVLVLLARPSYAADIYVSAADDLQAALDAAQGGDTIWLEPGATFTGNFRLPVHAGSMYVTVRSAAGNALLPRAGVRMSPAYAPYLPKIQSPNSMAALRTAPAAAYWRLMFLELGPNANTISDILDLGDGSAAQYDLSQVPHHLIVDRVYVHGDPQNGHKRGIGLNSANTTIVNSYVADIKAIGIDTQAIGGWNGPGPYRIENNYLEASTEVVLFGGDDPKIPGVTASDIVVRGNTLRRPVEWRNPILPAPTAVSAIASGTGSLAAGTYAYRVVARRYIGTTAVKSPATTEVPVTVTAGSRVKVAWTAVPGAVDYLVYGRTAGVTNAYWRVATTSFIDDGSSAGTAGTPSSASVWQVKNLFELKNARRVQVDHNLMENNWLQAQAGTAILFTPRNQYGSCTWCVVEDVTFEYNIVRSIGAGFQVLGYDNRNPSQQTNAIRIRNNEISDMNKTTWGGNGYFATVTDGPRDVTIDHNTIVSPSGGGVISVDGPAVPGFVFTNNVARHNSYGISGSGQGMGNTAINYYFPDGIIKRNVLAGGKASSYPSDNLFPTIADFESHFSDYAHADFTLVPGTNWEHAGTDGLDLGADEATLRVTPVEPPVDPPHVDTTSLDDTTEGFAYSAPVIAAGGVRPYRWSIAAGDVPSGIALDPVTGTLTGSALSAGDYAFTVQVQDATDTAATAPLRMRVIPQVTVVTTAVADGIATLQYAQAFAASGGLGSYTWTLTGDLPPGLTFTPEGLLSGTPASRGTFNFSITATDVADAARTATQPFTLFVAPPPNHPPTVAITSPAAGSVLQVGATVSIVAAASDDDGTVDHVDFYVNGALIGSAANGVAMPWTVSTAGAYELTAVATDDRRGSTTSASTVVTTRSEIVLYASDVARTAGNYQLVADASAAGGSALWNADQGAAKVGSAAIAPASYAEFTFYAEAGRPYHLWIRGRAQKNSWANDSAFVQFSGVPEARIGTTGALMYSVEEMVNAGVSGWGWQDNGYGSLNLLGANVTFDQTGPQTLRLQPREDGLSIDQIVISPAQFLTSAPGAAKGDTTVVAR